MKLQTAALPALALCALLGSAAVSPAQTSFTRVQGNNRQERRAEGPFEKLCRALDLTKEQREQARPIVREQMSTVRSIHEATGLSEQQKREQIRSARETFVTALDAILSPEQQEKLTTLLHLRRERRHEGNGTTTGGTTTTTTGDETTGDSTTVGSTTTTPN